MTRTPDRLVRAANGTACRNTTCRFPSTNRTDVAASLSEVTADHVELFPPVASPGDSLPNSRPHTYPDSKRAHWMRRVDHETWQRRGETRSREPRLSLSLSSLACRFSIRMPLFEAEAVVSPTCGPASTRLPTPAANKPCELARADRVWATATQMRL